MDIYDWILSEEIREHLRANHSLSFEEKILIIHTAYRSFEEKYAALQALSDEAETKEDRDFLSQMCRLYEWAFEQLHSEMPDQVFIYAEYKDRKNGEMRSGYLTEGVFHTYKELKEYAEKKNTWHPVQDGEIDTVTNNGQPDEEYDPDDILKIACIEKWAFVSGKMERIVAFDLFLIQGHYCLRDFLLQRSADGYDEFNRQMGFSGRMAELVQYGIGTNTLPLPFKHGDLVCLDLPCWPQPLYGVLAVAYDTFMAEYYGRKPELWIEMFYPDKFYSDNEQLESFCMACWDIDFTPNLPVIHWLRHAEPSELPKGQERLAELSSGLHCLMECDKKAAEKMLIPDGCQYIQDVINEINSILKEDVSL